MGTILWAVPRRLLFLLAGILAVAGCSRSSTAVDDGNRRQVLHIGNKDEPADLDPQANEAASTSRILHTLFEGLVEYSEDGQDLVPGAAASWTVSADGRTYTFRLRDHLRWSNGAPLTADDFRDSFRRIVDPELGCENAGYAFPITGARDFLDGRSKDPATIGIRSDGPQVLVITLDHPAPYILKVLASDPFYPVYMPSLDASGGRHQRAGPWALPGALVSNGPFILAAWKPNVLVRVAHNPNFWDADRVRLKEVVFHPTDDEAGEERDFRAGQLHVTYRLPETKVAIYEAGHPGELRLIPIRRTNFVTFNATQPPFSDPRVRRAFSLAIDREKLVHAALGKLGTPAHAWVRPGTGGFYPTQRFPYDPAEAAQLVAEAGFPKGTGFPATELTLNGNTGVTLSVAEILQQMWAQNLGIQVTLRPLEFKVYLSVDREKQYQVVLEGFSYYPDPHDLLELGVGGDPNNDAGAADPAYDAAFYATDGIRDPGRRLQAFDAVEAINGEQVFYAPLYYSNQGILVSPSVRGWPDRGSGAINWRDIFLEP